MRRLPTIWKEWLVFVGEKEFTETSKNSPVAHLAGSLVCVSFCLFVFFFSPFMENFGKRGL